MVIGPDFSRDAKPEDYAEISSLLDAAFGTPDESELVRQLRADGDMLIEDVTPWNGVIAGYAAISRMRAPIGWGCLAPVAVAPQFQNAAAAPNASQERHYHIGTRLVIGLVTAIQGLWEADSPIINLPSTIVVVGEPAFYKRAGFNADRCCNLKSPYPIQHTLIIRQGDDVPQETLIYPKAFYQLE